jgi:hypothetical protein
VLSVILIVVMALLTPAAAHQDNAWVRETVRKQRMADWHVHYDGRRYRYDGRAVRLRTRHAPATRTAVVTDPACRPWRRVIGEEANSRSGAITLVKRRWLNEVKHDWGVRYANIDRAHNAEMHCNPSTVTQMLKRTLWTCVIVGQPCRATEGESLKGKEFEGDAVDVDKVE